MNRKVIKSSRQILQERAEHMHIQTHSADSVHTFFYMVGHGFNAIKNSLEESQQKKLHQFFSHTLKNLCWHKTYIQNQQLPHHKTSLHYANVSIL